jgi:hypothetical protein
MSSEVKANKVSPASGTNFTFGDSGDTFTVPSGATLAVTGATVTGLSAGKVLQVVQTVKSDTFSTTSTTYVDVTGLSATITPSSTSNKIVASVTIIPTNSSTAFFFKLFRDAVEIGSGDAASGKEPCFTSGVSGGSSNGGGYYGLQQRSIEYLDSPSTTSATTYKIQCKTYNNTGTTYLNRTVWDAPEYNARGISTVTLWEIEG